MRGVLTALTSMVFTFCVAGEQTIQSNPATSKDEAIQKIESLIDKYFAAGQYNGALCVSRNGKVILQSTRGMANLELKVPNSIDTRFAIGSINKTITAMMMLKLVDQGKIDLMGTIRTYLPDYPPESGDKITVDQLLTHMSGMQGDISDYPPVGNQFSAEVAKINGDFYSLSEIVRKISERPLLAVPGSKYSYSSDGYAVLGQIAAKVHGKSYEATLHDLILTPYSLVNSGYAPQTRIVPKRASGYRQTFDGYEVARSLGITPAGGMYSTMGDLARIDQALFSNSLMSMASKRLAWTPSDRITSYGWKVRPDLYGPKQTSLRVQASGALPGFNSLMTRTLDDGLCVILLTNTRDIRFSLNEITEGVFAILRGREAAEPKASFARNFAAAERSRGLEAALLTFAQSRQSWFDGEYLDEAELNTLGYTYLALGKQKAAVAVFELNTQAFPKSGNAFDSLGEVYLAIGDRTRAKECYSRSLELDPKNDNARQMLKKIAEPSQRN